MTFFNKKEEVFQIELTPYGRYLLSIGRLQPHHYKFFDDDVVYNSRSLGYEEKQNESHVRIIEQTPKMKINANVSGVETSFSLNSSDAKASTDYTLPKKRITQKDDQINFFQRPIGTNSYETDKGCAFQVDLFRGKIVNSTKYMNTNNTVNLNIPQVDVDMVYRTSIRTLPQDIMNSEDIVGFNPSTGDGNYSTVPFDDGRYINIEYEDPIIRIKESNSFDEKENFEVEFFQVEVNATGEETYTPMKMLPKTQKIINNILMPDPQTISEFMEEATIEEDQGIGPDYIEYFLQINYDRQIPDIDLCRTIGTLQIKNIFLDEYVDCEDILAAEELPDLIDIYGTRVTNEDLEDCD